MEKGEIPDWPVNKTEQLKELEKWEEKVASAEKEKAKMLLLKLAADESRRNLQEELAKLKDLENQKAVESMTAQDKHQRQLSEIKEHNSKLNSEIQVLKDKLAAKKLKSEELRQTFRLRKAIPEKKVKFTQLESMTDEEADGNICCHFRIASDVPMKLNQGEALITFEEENGVSARESNINAVVAKLCVRTKEEFLWNLSTAKLTDPNCWRIRNDGRASGPKFRVAQGLIRKHEHHVDLENGKTANLKAQPVALETGVAFKLHAWISLKQIAVSNIPNLNIPEEWMRDKLELHFLKFGTGKVQSLSYNRSSQMALITFAQPKAVKDIVRYSEFPFHASGQAHWIQVSPTTQGMVEEFQMFSGISRRTILLTGIAEVEEDEESIQDMIAIHFQKPSNGGGEVEHIRYVSKGTKAAYFETGDDMTD